MATYLYRYSFSPLTEPRRQTLRSFALCGAIENVLIIYPREPSRGIEASVETINLHEESVGKSNTYFTGIQFLALSLQSWLSCPS